MQLEGLRKGLDDWDKKLEIETIYRQRLCAIQKSDAARARMILCWLSAAVRPPLVDALAKACGVEVHHSKEIQRLCSTDLVALRKGYKIKNSPGNPWAWGVQSESWLIDRVEFAHASVRKFLMSFKLADSDSVLLSTFRLDEHLVHLEVAKSCLGCFMQLDQRALTAEDCRGPSASLLRYSVMFSEYHCKRASGGIAHTKKQKTFQI